VEGLGLAHRQIGQNLAVDLDAGEREAVDKSAIGQTLLAGGGVDALEPQRTEIALFGATVAERVLQSLLDLLDRDAEDGGIAAPVALGELEDLLVAGTGVDAPFDA